MGQRLGLVCLPAASMQRPCPAGLAGLWCRRPTAADPDLGVDGTSVQERSTSTLPDSSQFNAFWWLDVLGHRPNAILDEFIKFSAVRRFFPSRSEQIKAWHQLLARQ